MTNTKLFEDFKIIAPSRSPRITKHAVPVRVDRRLAELDAADAATIRAAMLERYLGDPYGLALVEGIVARAAARGELEVPC